MANDFDKEPDGDRERQKKREREREEVERAARDLANDIRSSSLISNHDAKIAVSVSGWTVTLRVRLQMHLDDLGGFGTEALTRWGLEFKRLSCDVAIVAA